MQLTATHVIDAFLGMTHSPTYLWNLDNLHNLWINKVCIKQKIFIYFLTQRFMAGVPVTKDRY